MKRPRPRSVASKSVGVQEYKEALRFWRGDRGLTYHALLGPNLVGEIRAVTPNHMVQLASLFDKFIEAGCTNAMVLPSKLEVALKEIFAKDSCAGQTLGLDLYAVKVSKHIGVCFSMLRVLRLEEEKTSLSQRKSSHFQRKCSASEMAIVSKLASIITLDESTFERSGSSGSLTSESHSVVASPGQMRPSAAPARSSKESQTHSVAKKLDVSEVPCCFTKYLKKEVPPGSPVLPRFPTEKVKKKNPFDAEGFPVLPWAAPDEDDVISVGSSSPAKTPKPSSLVRPPEAMAPLTSTSKLRKRDVLEARENGATPDAPPVGAEAKQKKTVPPKQLDVALYVPSLSVSKNASNPRVELCCKDTAGNRVYVFGGTGPDFESDAKALRDYINSQPGVTKKAALEFIAGRRAAK